MALIKSKFRCLNIYVKDFNEAIELYEEMGFRIMETFGSEKVRKAHMKLSNQDQFMVSIICGSRDAGQITLTTDELFEGDIEGESEFDLKTFELLYYRSEDIS